MSAGVIRAAEEGDRRWFFGGGLHTWKVTEDESNGSLFLFEDEMTQGKLTPWHLHPNSDELIYMLDGEARVKIADEERLVTAGSTWMSPRGGPHAFAILSPKARLLSFQTPGQSARFYRGASEPATNGAGEVNFERIKEVAAETGDTVVLGPPPFKLD